MSVLPFRWHGSTRRAGIERLVEARAATWLREWAVAPDRVRCTIAGGGAPCHPVPEGGESWVAIRAVEESRAATAGTMLLRGPEYLLAQMGADLADVPVPARDPGEGVASRALAAFGTALFGASATATQMAAPAAGMLDARRGMVHVAWALGSLELDLFMDRALCDRMLPPAQVAGAALVPREEAIGKEPVSLRAVIDLGTASLEDALALRVGDIIRTDTPISAPVELHAGDDACVATGALVASGPNRGIRIIHPTRRTP